MSTLGPFRIEAGKDQQAPVVTFLVAFMEREATPDAFRIASPDQPLEEAKHCLRPVKSPYLLEYMF
jgi:hypothetical protein